MKYVIKRSQKKTTQQGKPFIKASLLQEDGKVIDNVSIWSDFPFFSELNSGVEVQGLVQQNARGYTHLKATPETQKPVQAVVEYENSSMPESTEDDRVEVIRHAQQRKHSAIAYFNATNSAIALVSSMKSRLLNSVNRAVIKQEIEYWREWFLNEWQKHDAQYKQS